MIVTVQNSSRLSQVYTENALAQSQVSGPKLQERVPGAIQTPSGRWGPDFDGEYRERVRRVLRLVAIVCSVRQLAIRSFRVAPLQVCGGRQFHGRCIAIAAPSGPSHFVLQATTTQL
ncbi:hypothetical protein M404DRAFT_995482 [Pisolithus tinctorius Marx 270]|uniref:Uncharacterized protein n=1 Tax=Pisolithus tinctorius Marx 270 TaxID=870435 RepID=A0A0C3JM95_PISTI|nr:hypothetical protein M404DRAFT_995482 [Pisolithus tinctorius Marx 270]